MWERLMDKTDISVCAAEWKLDMVPQTFRVSEEKNCNRVLQFMTFKKEKQILHIFRMSGGYKHTCSSSGGFKVVDVIC